MKEEKKVSIIVPIYNAQDTIENCVNSIINQTYKNIEIILVNDGSKDKSLEICYNLKKTDNRIIVIDKKNEKVSKTRNKGIEVAKGEYIMFVDADDIIELDMIEELTRGIQFFDLCACNYKKIENEKVSIKSNIEPFNTTKINEYIEMLKPEMLFNQLWNKIYRANIIKENNIKFNEHIQVGEDYLFNINYIANANSVNYINNPLYKYTIQENSLSKRFIDRPLEEEIKIVRDLKCLYEQKKFEMDYVYNEYIELLKSNILNLFIGNKGKNEIQQYIKQYRVELEKDKINTEQKVKFISKENKILYKAIKNNKVFFLYNYFKLRTMLKKSLHR